MKKRVLILGAAGRDFHNFNVYFRNNEEYEVVGFTATQIPDIEGRLYPPSLAGKLYKKVFQSMMKGYGKIIKEKKVDLVVFSYSDVSNQYVMSKGAEAMAAGASYMLLGPEQTYIKSTKPVVSIVAVRTGSGNHRQQELSLQFSEIWVTNSLL